MSEQGPVYLTTTPPADDQPPAVMPDDLSLPTPLPPSVRAYFERQREALIMQIRALDRALGRPQTIPERHR